MSTLIYNGIEFSEKANVSFSITNVYDDQNVIIIAHRYVVSVKDFVLPADCNSIADEMDEIRARLGRSGMRLEIAGHGLASDLDINWTSGNATWDIMGGPKPIKIQLEPLGGDNIAAHLTWECEFHLSPCEANYEGVAAFNYQTSHSINARGYTTRTINGYLQIAQRQIDAEHDPFQQGVLSDTADRYRDFITDRFSKYKNAEQQMTFSRSADASRLNFSIVDREHETPNAYPIGVISISAPTTSRFRWPHAEVSQTQTNLSVQLELEAGQPRVRAWEIFDGIMSQRFGLYLSEGKTRIIQELTIVEDHYSHRYSFNCSVTSVYALNDQLRLMKYFSPIPGNWQVWHDSMADVKHNRGLGKSVHLEDGDNQALHSLCDENNDEPADYGELVTPADKTLYALCSTLPPPDRSWLNADIALIEATEMQSTLQTTYGAATVEQAEFDSGDDGTFSTGTLTTTSGDYESCFSDAPPAQRWIWKGSIQRVGYPIPPISKVMIGEKEAKIVGTPFFYSRLVGYSFCLPVYEAVWNIGLVVIETPTIDESETDPTGNITEDSGV